MIMIDLILVPFVPKATSIVWLGLVVSTLCLGGGIFLRGRVKAQRA